MQPKSIQPAGADVDFDHLLKSNLQRVFNERDSAKRELAIAELFVDQPVMYEPDNVVEGREAISRIAGALLVRFGPTFRFTPQGRAVGHHGIATLRWSAGNEGDVHPAVEGFDTAEVLGGRISRLWVLIGLPTA